MSRKKLRYHKFLFIFFLVYAGLCFLSFQRKAVLAKKGERAMTCVDFDFDNDIFLKGGIISSIEADYRTIYDCCDRKNPKIVKEAYCIAGTCPEGYNGPVSECDIEPVESCTRNKRPDVCASGGYIIKNCPSGYECSGGACRKPPDKLCPSFPQGDANCDDKVNSLDFGFWRRSYQTDEGADFNDDETSDLLDCFICFDHYSHSF